MDRNQVLGLLLIFLIISLYLQFFGPEPSKNAPVAGKEKQLPGESRPTLKANQTTPSPADKKEMEKNLGKFAKLMQGETKDITLENEDIRVIFSSQGGIVKQVLLKKYKTSDQKPLILIDEKSYTQNLEVESSEGKKIDLYQLHYQTDAQDIQVKKGQSAVIKFKAALSPNSYIEHTYTLKGSGYAIDYDLKIKGLDKSLNLKKNAQLYWFNRMKRVESDLYYSRYYATINYTQADGSFNYLSWPSDNQEETELKESIHWVSFKQRFFSSAFIAKNKNIQNALLIKNTDLADSSTVKIAQAFMYLSLRDIQQGKGAYMLYFGPNRYQEMRKLDVYKFDKNIHLGWALFAWVSQFLIIPLFNFLALYISNYGILIILMVIIIKTFLLPLTFSSYKSMAKMRVLNELLEPELNKFRDTLIKKEIDKLKKDLNLNKPTLNEEEEAQLLKEKKKLYASHFAMGSEDAQKVQQEQMRLYGEMGTSPLAPMSGCLPLLLQMPILLALFIFFPNAIELRQQSFLWAHDLSTFDSILNLPFNIPGYGQHISLFTLLMTISTIALTYFNTQLQSSNAAMQGPIKYMGYIFPIVFMFVLNSYPSGLSFYYLIQNVVSIGQQSFFKKFLIDEDKIKAKFEDYKKKNKAGTAKKSSWMLKLEEAQKKARERAEEEKKKAAQKKK
ncbi:MAG: membrane protein insertase YidC [Microscillaceae bacterium]|nr:membrane protein insertase YidC [Microscillaceae bacterium]